MPDSTDSFEHLPAELSFLIEPARKYGQYQFDNQIAAFLEKATEREFAELQAVYDRIDARAHNPLIGEFFDNYPITDYRDSSLLYFLFVVFDAADVKSNAEYTRSIDDDIAELQRFGSRRLASLRAMAAERIASYGDEAKVAIPMLKRCLHDEDERVRVWANFALAKIEGNVDLHFRASAHFTQFR